MKPSEQIKERLNIVDIISQYIKLDPAGTNYKGLCPFHQEKTPSFFVSPEKGLWHCFGCGEGGDIFTFIEKQENINFKEALKILAKKANIKLDTFQPSYEDYLEERILKINNLAVKFYQKALKASHEGETAREYLKKRKLDSVAQKEFQIGYAPNRWRALYDFLLKKGFNNAEIVQSGLIIQKDNNKFYDRFRARLMFTLKNVYGEVVGMAGRKLENIENSLDKNPGKYINSPEAKLYHKSNFLYNLDKAKESIRDQNFVIIAEGYTDVISSYLKGACNIVASSGTALTLGQLQLIKRYTNNLALAYDADSAGNKATERGIELALNQGFNLQVIDLPNGQDPDDIARNNFNLWKKLIKERIPIMEFYFRLYLKNADLKNLAVKRESANKLLFLIKCIQDLIERSYWLRKLSYALGLDEEILEKMLEKINTDNTNDPSSVIPNQTTNINQNFSENNALKPEERLLGFLINFPQKIKKIKAEYFQDCPKIFSIYKILKKQYNKKVFDQKNFLSIIKEKYSPIYSNIVKVLIYLEQDLTNQTKTDQEDNFLILKKRIKKTHYWRKLKKLEFQIAQAEDNGQEDKAEKLGFKFQKISKIYQKL